MVVLSLRLNCDVPLFILNAGGKVLAKSDKILFERL